MLLSLKDIIQPSAVLWHVVNLKVISDRLTSQKCPGRSKNPPVIPIYVVSISIVPARMPKKTLANIGFDSIIIVADVWTGGLN